MDGNSATDFILKPDPENGDDGCVIDLSGGKMEEREADANRSMNPQPTKKGYLKWKTVLLAYQSLGVVYGDLGTSPVNVFSATNLTNLTEDDLLGTLSLIIWTLTILVLIKYVFIVLHANDHGEGGTFALYSYICRHVNFKSRFTVQNTRPESDSTMENYGGVRSPISRRSKEFLEGSTRAQNFLTILVLLGTCMVIGDYTSGWIDII